MAYGKMHQVVTLRFFIDTREWKYAENILNIFRVITEIMYLRMSTFHASYDIVFYVINWFECNGFVELTQNVSDWVKVHWILRVRAFYHHTFQVYHVYHNFILGYFCRIAVNFWTLKVGSHLINSFASNNCFSDRNIFQNGGDALSKIDDAFFYQKLDISCC